MKLEVHSALEDENYLDIVRIPRDLRTTRHGDPIESGSVCRIYRADTGKEAYVVARGLGGEGRRYGLTTIFDRSWESLIDKLTTSS